MKPATAILALLLPVTASAQNYQGMSEQDMQNMMQQMQEMQTCMQDIDQSRLEAFEQRATRAEAEVKSLCASGKRDAAQQEAIAFAREVSSDPDIQKMRKCTENMQDMMPRMPYMDQASEPDTSANHVCDQ
jgi:type II secretory pathway component PulJ